MQRKEPLTTGEIYHVYNKSIAGFKIFEYDANRLRMENMLQYYQAKDVRNGFAYFLQSKEITNAEFTKLFYLLFGASSKIVQIIAYCIMPTHLHLILKQLEEDSISTFMGNILNSYSRYFNTKYKRNGPLWQGRFQNVRIKTDEQLLHLTRYIHLNPTTSHLVDDPESWRWSSYKEYISNTESDRRICEYRDVLDIECNKYKRFVKDRISYQRELKKIKDLLLE